MNKDLNQIFEELLKRYTAVIEKEYLHRYKKAKDKEFILAELKNDTDFVLGWETLTLENSKLIDVFSTRYKRGEDINDILNHIKKTFGEVDDELPFKRIENGKKITIYLSEEEKALKKLALDKRKLFKLLIRSIAFTDIQKRMTEMFSETTLKSKLNSYNGLKWTAKKDNKNEFVQLIYGLHKAGFINEGKGEITKIIETLAEIFKIELGKGWQANHSSSIHKGNRDYKAKIFKTIEEAYHNYCEELRESAKKRR